MRNSSEKKEQFSQQAPLNNSEAKRVTLLANEYRG
jgi:hypothetical protein